MYFSNKILWYVIYYRQIIILLEKCWHFLYDAQTDFIGDARWVFSARIGKYSVPSVCVCWKRPLKDKSWDICSNEWYTRCVRLAVACPAMKYFILWWWFVLEAVCLLLLVVFVKSCSIWNRLNWEVIQRYGVYIWEFIYMFERGIISLPKHNQYVSWVETPFEKKFTLYYK